jgi:hypothetical protein
MPSYSSMNFFFGPQTQKASNYGFISSRQKEKEIQICLLNSVCAVLRCLRLIPIS